MAGIWRISLSIDSPVRSMLIAMRRVPADVRRQIGQQTKRAGQPIWFEELRDGAATRQQQRVLVDPGRVSVTQRNISLRTGQTGSMRNGTPVSRLAVGAEFGMAPAKPIVSKTKGGKAYKRTAGQQFPARRPSGYVFHPAAKRAIPRVASLWVQTAVRTIMDAFDGRS
ncbi:hypothetical protein [Microbacterium sp. NPDC057650]|uniref:hypothetical protein n=1 Tax=unclassified Microbacterium TaxID=2609290 RepID=UPI00366C2EC4